MSTIDLFYWEISVIAICFRFFFPSELKAKMNIMQSEDKKDFV